MLKNVLNSNKNVNKNIFISKGLRIWLFIRGWDRVETMINMT
jgi:hypothetical protein